MCRTEKKEMMVIEVEKSEEKIVNPPKTASHKEGSTEVFETAKDGELGDHDHHDGIANGGHNGHDQQQKQLENAPVDDEIKQVEFEYRFCLDHVQI